MADEPIGSVSINITGDYSGLEKSFTDAQNLAQRAGQQISAGLESGAAGADSLTSATLLTDDQIQNLFNDGMKLAEQWTKTGGSFEDAAEGMRSMGGASSAAGAGVEDLGDKFKRVRNDAEAFEKAWGEALVENKRRTEELNNATSALENSVLSLVAAVVSFQALKQLGEDSLTAYGHLQQLTTSLDLMGAGAAGAALDVEKLKALAIQTATPFDELGAQARKLSAVFGTGQNMFAVLKAAADDAAATGRSFDTVANGLERIEAVGALTGRQLVTLGISWEQMAASMGVSVEEAQRRMKQGGQSASQDVADTINAIESKFAGASERQAANVLGVWANVKNQATFIFQTLGEQMGGLGPIFSEALKIAASGVVVFIGGIQQVTVAIIGMVREGAEGLKGLGAVAIASMKGDFAGAALAAVDAYGKVKTASEYTDQSLQDHAKKTAEALIAIWADHSTKVATAFKPTGEGGKAGLTDEQYKAMSAEIDAETAHQKSLIQIKRMGYQEDEKLHQISAFDNLARLQALTDQELAIVQSGIAKKQALEKQKGEGSKEARLDKESQKAEDAAAIESIKLAQHVSEVKQKLLDDDAKYIERKLNEETKFDEDVKAHVAKLNTEMADDRLKALALETVGEEKHQVAVLEMARSRAAYEQSIGAISASQRIAIDQQIDAEEDELQRKAIQREIDLLDQKSGANVQYASKKQALENQLQALQDKREGKEQNNIQKTTQGLNEVNDQLAKQIDNYRKVGEGVGAIGDREEKRLSQLIELDRLQGKSANAHIIALENERIKNDALNESTRLLGDLYVDLVKDFKNAYDALGKGIADSIVDGKNFWDSWHKILNDLEKQILEQVVKTALHAIADALINNINLAGQLASVLAKIGIGVGGAATSAAKAGTTIIDESGAIAEIGGAAASTAGEAGGVAAKAAGLGISGITNMVTGAISAVSGVVGNFQMAGMNKSLDLIENYTRYLKIGLVEQGDSLLNDQHVIRNTLTDFMKWNWGVATTYFQGISEKLDTLIGLGQGVHPMAAQAVAKMTVDAAASVPSDLKTGGDVIVNIDTVAPDVTDTKVRDTMNRAVRMSKLAGAFPPNRFPS